MLGIETVNDRCVYFHSTPDTKEVFYIGIGTRKRAFTFRQRNKHWNKIVELHGKPVVSIILENVSMETAAESEKFWIKHHGLERLANISPGGDGVGGFTHTEETRLKIAKAGIGRKHTEQSKEKMRKARLGVKISKENIDKIIIANTGRKRTKSHSLKLLEANRDKTLYELFHPEFGKVITTQLEFRIKYNLKGPRLSELLKGKRNKYHGWKLIVPTG